MATIVQNVAVERKTAVYREQRMYQRKTLVYPSDGGSPYLKESVYSLVGSKTKLQSSDLVVEGRYKTRRILDDFELRRGRKEILPDLPYNWSINRRKGGKYVFVDGLRATGTVAYDYAAQRYSWDANYWLPWGHGHTLQLVSDSELNLRLLTKAKGEIWNSPVFALEARKTTDMVVSRAADLVGLLRSLRKGRIDHFLDALRKKANTRQRNAIKRAYNKDYGSGDPTKAAANAWLETTYGWTPFVQDVYQSLETLGDIMSDERNMVGSVKTGLKRQTSQKSVRTATAPLFAGELKRYFTYKESRRAEWKFRPRTDLYSFGKLGLTNPASVAWELLPFSFVADWFLPIGDYLNTLDAPLLLQHVGGSRGLRRETQGFEVYRAYQTSTSVSSGGIGHWESLGIARTPITSTPVVSLDSVVFRPKLGASRVTSAVALLRQNVGRVLGSR